MYIDMDIYLEYYYPILLGIFSPIEASHAAGPSISICCITILYQLGSSAYSPPACTRIEFKNPFTSNLDETTVTP
jgi:hypothetical protein